MKKKILIIVLALVVLTGLYFVFINRAKIRGNFDLWYRRAILPAEQEYVPATQLVIKDSEEVVENNNNVPETSINQDQKQLSDPPEKVVSAKINLAVPFVSQAPFRVWDEIHNDTCEEASVLMVNGFYKKETYTSQEMEDHLLYMVDWQKENFGFFEDTTAEETAIMMKEIYGLNAQVYYDITIDDLKKALSNGQPVIVPASGKLLPNPYFRNGGPVYHMLVLKGFTKDNKFISHDPGTNTLGENFIYTFDALYNAIHDWTKGEDILTGRKAMIVVE